MRKVGIVSPGWTDEERFLRLQASGTNEGCFLCVLKREEAETVQDILVRATAKGLLSGLALPEKVKTTRRKEKRRGAPAAPPHPDPSLTSDPSVSEQLHTDSTVPGGTLEHIQDSHGPSPALNDGSANLSHDSVDEPGKNQASKATDQQKKGSRRKSRVSKRSRRVKTKTRTIHKRRTRSSRKKLLRVQPV